VITEEIRVVPQCVECGQVWVPTEGDCWRCNFDTDSELFLHCPDCAEQEFDDENTADVVRR
jgi:hypothetical protein